MSDKWRIGPKRTCFFKKKKIRGYHPTPPHSPSFSVSLQAWRYTDSSSSMSHWRPCPPICHPGSPCSNISPRSSLTGSKKEISGLLRNTTVDNRTNPPERISIPPGREGEGGGCRALLQLPTKVVVEQFWLFLAIAWAFLSRFIGSFGIFHCTCARKLFLHLWHD